MWLHVEVAGEVRWFVVATLYEFVRSRQLSVTGR